MIIGVPKEIKKAEYRVATTPACVRVLSEQGHKVIIETNAGKGSGFVDEDFRKVGAKITDDREKLFDNAELILKVKEPLPEEYASLHEGQVLFTYLHLAADKDLTKALIKAKIVALAYETVQKEDGSLPLLAPMSEIAGRISPLVGAFYLSKYTGGCGKFIGGVPGVLPAKVTIIGGGTVGINAAKIAAGMRASVTILEVDVERMRYLDDVMPANVTTLMCNLHNLELILPHTDLFIGAVLIPGAKTPQIITRKMLHLMKEGSIIVDVAVDQGGCVETTRPTTHDEPIFKIEGIVHYCVSNIPGTYPQTSTLALSNVTFPYVLKIANEGYRDALKKDSTLAKGANIVLGKLISNEVAVAHNFAFSPIKEALN